MKEAPFIRPTAWCFTCRGEAERCRVCGGKGYLWLYPIPRSKRKNPENLYEYEKLH